MKKNIIGLLLAMLIAPSVYASCEAPSSTDESIQCLVDSFNLHKNNPALFNSAGEIYQFNYMLAQSAMIKSSSSFELAYSTPAYFYYYHTTILKDLQQLSADVKHGDTTKIPSDFKTYQTHRRDAFSNVLTKGFANYMLNKELQLLGRVEGLNDDKAKAEEYAKLNVVSYLLPAELYDLYAFMAKDAPKYLNSAVLNYTQVDCEANLAQFQGEFAKQVARNGALNFIVDASHPGSLLRDISPVLSSNYAQYVIGSLDALYAFSEGKAVNGSTYSSYNICNYELFKQTAQFSNNPYTTLLNNIVNTTATKTAYPAQTIYWVLTAMLAKGLIQSLANVSISAASTTLPF